MELVIDILRGKKPPPPLSAPTISSSYRSARQCNAMKSFIFTIPVGVFIPVVVIVPSQAREVVNSAANENALVSGPRFRSLFYSSPFNTEFLFDL
jgi:hypothetical protein